MSDLDSEIEALQRQLRKLQKQKDRQVEIATAELRLQKAKMNAQKDELKETPYYKALREVLIKVGEDNIVKEFRKALGLKAEEQSNPLVV